MTTIAVADDSEVIRGLVDEIIRSDDALELVASFASGPEIVAWTRDGGRADLYLIDMRLPGLSGTATIRAIRRFVPSARVIAFSASAQESSVQSALAAGANRYVLKDASLTELLRALRTGDEDVAVPTVRPDPPVTESAPVDAPVAASNPPTPQAFVAATDVGDRPVAPHFTVMVVDDHDIVRDTTAALLESRGLNTACFASAEDAFDWLATGGNPEAALVDLRLGGEPDTTLLGRLREALPTSAIFLHSGTSTVEARLIVRQCDADGFIAKGELSAARLAEELAVAVARRRAEA